MVRFFVVFDNLFTAWGLATTAFTIGGLLVVGATLTFMITRTTH